MVSLDLTDIDKYVLRESPSSVVSVNSYAERRMSHAPTRPNVTKKEDSKVESNKLGDHMTQISRWLSLIWRSLQSYDWIATKWNLCWTRPRETRIGGTDSLLLEELEVSEGHLSSVFWNVDPVIPLVLHNFIYFSLQVIFLTFSLFLQFALGSTSARRQMTLSKRLSFPIPF